MKGFRAQCASNEIFLIAKRPTQIAHLLKHKPGVVKAAPDGIRVVTPFVIFSLVVLHHLLEALVLENRHDGGSGA